MVFFHDFSQVCLSLQNKFVILFYFIFGTCYEYPHEPQVYSGGRMQMFKFFFNTLYQRESGWVLFPSSCYEYCVVADYARDIYACQS